MDNKLTQEERGILLETARKAIKSVLEGKEPPEVDFDNLPENLQQPGATFVTITKHGTLRGCIGTLEAKAPLIEDTIEHAIAAAKHDFRFSPLTLSELDDIRIEISRLSSPEIVNYSDAQSLLDQLQPGKDGVILKESRSRATFLPQVWSKIPDKEDFLDHLCMKMGAPPNRWREGKVTVLKYQVEEIHE
jgi:AmmeMemoRadiSam system protein A